MTHYPPSPLVLVLINMATYSGCRFPASRLPSHPRRRGRDAEEEPIQDQAVAARSADAADARPEIYAAIFCRPPGQDDPAGGRRVVQRRHRRRALGGTRRGQSVAQTVLPRTPGRLGGATTPGPPPAFPPPAVVVQIKAR